MTHFNKLTPAQAERLALLAEELADAIQAAGKILRHGYESKNPILAGNANKENLERELGHVMYAVYLLKASGDIGEEPICRSIDEKTATAPRWMHHQDFASLYQPEADGTHE